MILMVSFLKKTFNFKIFLLVIFNTVSISILSIIFIQGKKTQTITRTISCITEQPLPSHEIEEFITNLELPSGVRVSLINVENISYEQRISLLIKHTSKDTEALIDSLNQQWANSFSSRCINLASLKEKALPEIIYDTNNSVLIITETNNYTGKIPEFVSLKSLSTTAEKINIYNMVAMENASTIEIAKTARIMVMGANYSIPRARGVRLMAIKFENKTTFFKLEQIIF